MKAKFRALRNHLGNMVSSDPIADMLSSMKNAAAAGRRHLSVPASRIKEAIADLLVKEGYLKSFVKKGKKIKKFLELELAYADETPRLRGVKRISKPSRRMYRGAGEIKPVKQGTGIGVYSTPRGLLTNKRAFKEKVGGEYLFEIW